MNLKTRVDTQTKRQMLNCKEIIGTVKTYFMINDIVKLSTISKIWCNTPSFSPILIIDNSTDKTLFLALQHINLSILKHIFVCTSVSDDALLSEKNIINFVTKINTKTKLHSINIYNPIHVRNNCSYDYKLNYNSTTPNCTSNDWKKISGMYISEPINRPCIFDEMDFKKYYAGHNTYGDYYYENKCVFSVRCRNINLKDIINHIIDLIMMSKLRYLRFFCDVFTQNNVDFLYDLKKTNLKYLDIGWCNYLTNEANKTIITGLKDTNLEYFDISFVNLTDADIEQLILAIKKTDLRHFNMSNCHTIANIQFNLNQLNNKLQYLNISECNEITNVGLKTLLEGLSETNIVSLNLQDSNNITDENLMCLVTKLKNTNVRHIDLSHSSLSNDNLRGFIKALKNNDIESFDLSGTDLKITDSTMSIILNMIDKNL